MFVTHLAAAILAHQGGWDEMLLVAVPMVVVAWLLWLAKRRMARAAQAGPETAEPTTAPDD